MRRRTKTAAEYVDGRGVRLVSISTLEKQRFARACLITMTLRDGRDRSFLIRTARSIDVPIDVIDETRLRLKASGHYEGTDNE